MCSTHFLLLDMMTFSNILFHNQFEDFGVTFLWVIQSIQFNMPYSYVQYSNILIIILPLNSNLKMYYN